MKSPRRVVVIAAAALPLLSIAVLRAQADKSSACASLASQTLPNTTISAAQAITTGSFTPPGSTNPITNLPPFCRVAGTIAPTSESEILFEVWLPLENWNGKFAGVGNGGWAGTISFAQIQDQLRRGYAAASNNTGHRAGPQLDAAKFAFDHPEQLIDFAYRAHHETTVKAKALVNAFYGKPPEKSYWFGCSSGGYEGLQEAQRFPADYDAILAAAPANNFTKLMAARLRRNRGGPEGSGQQPAGIGTGRSLSRDARGVRRRRWRLGWRGRGSASLPVRSRRRCSAGRIRNPKRACRPHRSKPRGACIVALSIPRAAQRSIRGRHSAASRSGPIAIPATRFRFRSRYYKWLVFGDPNWDWKSFDWSRPSDYEAWARAEAKFAPILNATNPDLREFSKRGGKLLQWHGWSDQLIAAENSIDYYESVVKLFGGRANVDSFYRLFMAPGTTHCAGGPGPSTFDMQAALEAWVEKGVAPEQIIASHLTNGIVDRLRPLCAYPKVATYKGKGDTNDAENFVCRRAL